MAKIPEDRPSVRDTVARAQAAAAPKIARAQSKAGPAAEKAAANAGKLLGTLRDRAKTTLKEFNTALNSEDGTAAGEAGPGGAATDATAPEGTAPKTPGARPRPRPRPTKE